MAIPTTTTQKARVGLAFQGGGFPAGAVGAGVVRYLVENGAFSRYDIDVFSGTSAGALVAAVCWGNKLKGTIEEAPKTLREQWMYFALGLVPDPAVAQISELANSLAQMNPFYQAYSQNVFVPFMRQLLEHWIVKYIPIDEFKALSSKATHVPGLLLGAADVLRGEVKVFTEKDFSIDALLASGSLDEVNGITVIKEDSNKGIYCDGAWGCNPPLTPMIDYGIDELWFVEFFPKKRDKIPRTPAERKDRKDELWQNSLVEHELYVINKVNEWLRDKKLNDPSKRIIAVKKMPMELDLPAGSAYVNSPSFIEEMMAYGYNHAEVFLR